MILKSIILLLVITVLSVRGQSLLGCVNDYATAVDANSTTATITFYMNCTAFTSDTPTSCTLRHLEINRTSSVVSGTGYYSCAFEVESTTAIQNDTLAVRVTSGIDYTADVYISKQPTIVTIVPSEATTSGTGDDDAPVIVGSNFYNSSRLHCVYCGVYSPNTTFIESHVIRCRAPPHLDNQNCTVSVTNDGGFVFSETTTASAFNYYVDPDHIGITQNPSTMCSGSGVYNPLTVPPIVQLYDEKNFTVQKADISVYVDVHTNTSSSPKRAEGLMVTTNAAGIAVFSDLKIEGYQTESYILSFSSPGVNGIDYCCVSTASCSELIPNSELVVVNSVSTCVCEPGYGYLNNAGNVTCTACHLGSYKDSSDNVACTSCFDHEVTSNNRSTSRDNCTCSPSFKRLYECSGVNTDIGCVCGAGYGFDAKNRLCTVCPKGTFKSSCSLEYCISCPAHETTDGSGATSIDDCKCIDGFDRINQNGTEHGLCVCAVGWTNDVLTSKCVRCPLNTYKDFNGTDPCKQCPNNEETSYIGSKLRADCLCKPGTYRDSVSTNCETCPVGAICEGAAAQPYAQSGFFQSGQDALVFLNCRVGAVCLLNSTCAAGYTGTACGDCKPDHFRVDVDCFYCTPVAKIMWIVYIALVALLLLGMYVRSYKTKGGMVLGGAVIAANTLQALGILSRVAVNWPSDLLWMLRSFSFLYINPQMFAPECYFGTRASFYDTLVRSMWIPAVAFVWLWVISLLFLIYSYIVPLMRMCMPSLFTIRADSNWFKRMLFDVPTERLNMVYASVRSCSVLLWMVVPLVFSTALELFSCHEQVDKSVTLAIAPATICYTEEWHASVPLALGGVAVYCIVLPAIYAAVLWSTRGHQYSSAVFYSLSFVYERYVRRYWYWEGVQLARRLALVALVVAFETEVHLLVLLVVVLQVLLGLLHSKYAPYRWGVHNVFEVTSDCVLAVTLMVGNVFASSLGDERVTMGMKIVVYVLLLFLFGSVVILVVFELRLAKDALKVDSIRRETMTAMDEMADLGGISPSSNTSSKRLYSTDFSTIAPNVDVSQENDFTNDSVSNTDVSYGSTPRSFTAEIL